MASSSETLASYYLGSGTPIVPAVNPLTVRRWDIGGSVVVQNFPLESPVDILSRNISELTEAIQILIQRINALEDRLEALSPIEIEARDITDEQAKEEIKKWFEDRHGEILFPSDVADELSLDYDVVVRLLTDLENEGKVRSASNADGDAGNSI